MQIHATRSKVGAGRIRVDVYHPLVIGAMLIIPVDEAYEVRGWTIRAWNFVSSMPDSDSGCKKLDAKSFVEARRRKLDSAQIPLVT